MHKNLNYILIKKELISAVDELPHSTPENKSTMVKVWFLRMKYQKNSFCWHRHEINDIYQAYYQAEILPTIDIIHGEPIETDTEEKMVYSHSSTNVMKRFKIRSVPELMFLLAQHPENQQNRCEYCKEGFVFHNRTGQTVTCGHNGFCRFENCNEPIQGYTFCDNHMHTDR